jgi:hypothetical protein
LAVSPVDLHANTETYGIYRHPDGDCMDVLHWAAQGERPARRAELFARAELRRGARTTAAMSFDRVGLAKRGAELEAARQFLNKCAGKVLVYMQLCPSGGIIVRRCGPNDLVTTGRGRLQ